MNNVSTDKPGNPALSISKLNKRYGEHRVIRDLDLQVSAGAIHGLVGLNGSGKTTTLECVLGLQGFDGGNIEVLGNEPARLHQSEGKIVAIFDSPSLNPNLTVRQCLQHAAILCAEPLRKPAEVEALLGIESFSKFKIKNLSLGNKRRASIAQALIGNPQLILLDEPFNGLDAGGVDDVLNLIETLNRENGTTFLLSSHQLPYLEQVCSHIAILHEGCITLSDSKEKLLQDSHSILKLKTSEAEQARNLLAENSEIEILETKDSSYLYLTSHLDSAQINQMLVSQHIPVSELILQRASLDSMFRHITSGDDT